MSRTRDKILRAAGFNGSLVLIICSPPPSAFLNAAAELRRFEVREWNLEDCTVPTAGNGRTKRGKRRSRGAVRNG